MSSPSRDVIVSALEHVAQFGVTAPGTAHLFDVGTGPFLEFFRSEVFEGFVAHGAGTLRFFEGPYGSGKSHLLDLLAEASLDAGLAVARIDLSAAAGLADWHLLTQRVLEDLEVRLAGGTVRSLPLILELLADGREAGHWKLTDGRLPHAGFAQAMQLRLRGSLGPVAPGLLRQYLVGERVAVRDLAAAGLAGVKHPLSRRNAEYVLRTVLAGLRRAGLRGTLLVFDESERSLQRQSLKVRTGANVVRRFVDAAAAGSLENCAVVFAILPGFVEAAAEFYPALGQRLFRVRTGDNPPWRAPLLTLSEVSSTTDVRAFARGLAERLEKLVSEFEAAPYGLQKTLSLVADAAIAANAGAGVRRDICKAMCAATLRHIEHGGTRR